MAASHELRRGVARDETWDGWELVDSPSPRHRGHRSRTRSRSPSRRIGHEVARPDHPTDEATAAATHGVPSANPLTVPRPHENLKVCRQAIQPFCSDRLVFA